MEDTLVLTSELSIAENTDPRVMKLKFVFTDFAPNGNGIAIPENEAQNIINTAALMPVLVNFDDGPRGHSHAVPIGPITNTYLDNGKIIGEAILWKKEMPYVADWIETAHASEEGVHFSWEIYHNQNNAQVIDGVTYIHDLLVKGITIVERPAYQGRTPLLSYAESDKIAALETQVRELSERVDALREERNMSENIQTSEADVQTNDELEQLRSEVVTLRQFKADVEAKEEKRLRLEQRKAKLSELGVLMSEERFNASAEFIAGLTDEVFTQYADDLAHVSKRDVQTTQSNSEQSTFVPEPVTSTRPASGLTPKELAKALKERRKVN